MIEKKIKVESTSEGIKACLESLFSGDVGKQLINSVELGTRARLNYPNNGDVTGVSLASPTWEPGIYDICFPPGERPMMSGSDKVAIIHLYETGFRDDDLLDFELSLHEEEDEDEG